jgi:hypothetical protein
MTTENIASRAMLVSLKIGQWTARKLDKSATQEVTVNHAAASDAGRFNKQIIDKNSLLPMVQIAGAARTFFYQHTLPWSDNGDRVLSSDNYFTVMNRLRELKSDFKAAVDVFCRDYDMHRDRAKLHLNSLFNEADYPQSWEIREKFYMYFSVMPLPVAGDFRVAMGDDVVDEVRQEIEAQLTSRVQGMVQSIWTELVGTVSHLRDRLKGDGPLFSSALDNIVDLIDRLPGLNITNDADLDAMRKELRLLTAGLDMKDIKKDDALRTSVIDKTTDILKQMQGFCA